jgi:hypothetical protein
MLRRVAFVRTDVSEELSAFFIMVTRIGELGTTLAVTTAKKYRSDRRENLKSYIIYNIIQLFPRTIIVSRNRTGCE